MLSASFVSGVTTFLKTKVITTKLIPVCYHVLSKVETPVPVPELSVQDILTNNEEDVTISEKNIRVFANQVSANRPEEDRWSVSKLNNNQVLLSVVDGHNGPSCAHAVNSRAPDYLAVAMMDKQELQQLSTFVGYRNFSLSTSFRNDQNSMSDEVASVHCNQVMNYLRKLTAGHHDLPVQHRLPHCLLQLDEDICSAVNPTKTGDIHLSKSLLRTAISGCVATFCIIDKNDVWISHVGDCSAVIGSKSDDTWMTHKLTEEHNASNACEVHRILKEHPTYEHSFILKNDRLLGELMPLRAFGNIRFKWQGNELLSLASRLDLPRHYRPTPHHYHSPPYLHALPDIVHRGLTKDDKFIILASDGLWDLISCNEAVAIVGEMLESHSHPVSTSNLATGLIHAALSAYKPGQQAANGDLLNRLLSLPPRVARFYRDDITVCIALLNQ